MGSVLQVENLLETLLKIYQENLYPSYFLLTYPLSICSLNRCYVPITEPKSDQPHHNATIHVTFLGGY